MDPSFSSRREQGVESWSVPGAGTVFEMTWRQVKPVVIVHGTYPQTVTAAIGLATICPFGDVVT